MLFFFVESLLIVYLLGVIPVISANYFLWKSWHLNLIFINYSPRFGKGTSLITWLTQVHQKWQHGTLHRGLVRCKQIMHQPYNGTTSRHKLQLYWWIIWWHQRGPHSAFLPSQANNTDIHKYQVLVNEWSEHWFVCPGWISHISLRLRKWAWYLTYHNLKGTG